MNHASLFSGIGGAEVAASMMGWKNLFHCEIQEFPRKVLNYWFPNSISYEDITKTDFKMWGARSMFSQEDFLVSHSASPAEEKERTMTVISGRRCFGRYGKFTPLGSLVKTLVESKRWWSPVKSLRWDAQIICSKRITYTEKKADSHSTESVETSKPKDIPSNRLLFQLAPSEHPTEETESGLLPTPTALDKGGGRINKSLSPGAAERPTLALAARKGLLPEPDNLDFDSTTDGGAFLLNPLFVEEMMGFPLMWTTLPFLSQNGGKSR